jgi:hypothetical protein
VRNVLLAAVLVASVGIAACDRSVAETKPPRLPRDFHSRVTLGTTTPADVERLFGAPDQRAEDGSLVYGSDHTRPSGKVEHETTTFRFDGGVLSKICQSRS